MHADSKRPRLIGGTGLKAHELKAEEYAADGGLSFAKTTRYTQCPPRLLAPLVKMSKWGCTKINLLENELNLTLKIF